MLACVMQQCAEGNVAFFANNFEWYRTSLVIRAFVLKCKGSSSFGRVALIGSHNPERKKFTLFLCMQLVVK